MKKIAAIFDNEDVQSVTIAFDGQELRTIPFCIYLSLVHHVPDWLRNKPDITIDEWMKRNEMELELMCGILLVSGYPSVAKMFLNDLRKLFKNKQKTMKKRKGELLLFPPIQQG
jgi:hypothetical protein